MTEKDEIKMMLEGIYTDDIYTTEFEQPLLEYIRVLAQKIRPYGEEDWNCGYTEATPTLNFCYRYAKNKIVISSRKDYLKNIEVINTIKAFGYDSDKFWYLVLFISDFTSCYINNSFKWDDSAYQQIERFLNGIVMGMESINYKKEIVFSEPTKIVLERGGKNKKIIIDNPLALTWLTQILNQEKKKIENSERFKTSEPKSILTKPNPLSKSVRVYYFAKLFITFFELNPPQKGRSKQGDLVSFNKLLLISRLIYIMKLSDEVNFLDSDDTLKGFLKQYKDLKFDQTNMDYF